MHQLTDNPTEAWKEISKSQRVIKVTTRPPSSAIVPSNKARVVVMADTHSLNPRFDIPEGDIFIHAGDFTKCGGKSEVEDFNRWLGESSEIENQRKENSILILRLIAGKLPHKHKLVIAGNHELSFDPTFTHPFKHLSPCCSKKTAGALDEIPTLGNTKESLEEAVKVENVKQYLTNCTYLEDELIEIFGLRIYGSPWQPEFCKWAFNLPRGQPCLEKWNKIPKGLDILITHTPPLGHGDLCCSGVRAGCVELLSTVQQRVKPKYHVFGHVHEGYGITSDGKVIYINASTCDLNYLPNNPPIVFDVALPPNAIKE